MPYVYEYLVLPLVSIQSVPYDEEAEPCLYSVMLSYEKESNECVVFFLMRDLDDKRNIFLYMQL